MKDRTKWILVGLGFTFGLQVIISLIFTGIVRNPAGNNEDAVRDPILMAAFGLTLGAYMIGGFVIGWMSEEVRVLDSLFVTVATMVLISLVYVALPHANRGQFVSGYFLSGIKLGSIFASLALIAAAVGAYWGWHVTVPQEGVLDRVALLVGLLGAIIGPFVLLAISGSDPNNPNETSLPWYFLVIVLVIVLAIIGVGFLMFTREPHDEDISISPEHHKEQDAEGSRQ
ncbi:MAG TPA: hypothetical protein VJZ26_18500 [Blastocatellia bacterium]|nr:hypothetical protein [Blastocatellia bacterium]